MRSFVDNAGARGVGDANSRAGHPFAVTHHEAPAIAASTAARRSFASHEAAVLAFYTGGSARFEQGATWSVREGDALFIPSSQPHRMLETEGVHCWGLGIFPAALTTSDRALLAPFERVRGGGAAVVQIPEERRPFLSALFQELDRECARPGSSERVVTSLVTLVVEEVGRAGRADGGTDERRGESYGPSGLGVVADSLRFIEANCLSPLGLSDVARAVGRSPAHLTTEIRKATGRTAVEWIIAGRMSEARRLLLHSEESVERIAERVGYRDPTHFIRLFRRMHGKTPTAWRRARG